MAPTLYWVLTAVLIVVLVVSALLALQTANRLDRLHVRYDLSWQALDGALARRAVVARAVAADTYRGRPEGKRLAALADAAERAPRSNREAAENELSAALATVDPTSMPVALVAELADAEARVLLARRFHNDAVRDTLALRERRPVRWLRLGGTAALPTYFEIAERAGRQPQRTTPNGWTAAPRRGWCCSTTRVRCCCSAGPTRPSPAAWRRAGGSPSAARPCRGSGWSTPPSARSPRRPDCGSTPAEMVGPVWRRDSLIDFNGTVVSSQEFYFVHRTARFEPTAAGRTQLELRYIHGHRWCDSATIDQLAAGGQTVYPLQLGELLAEANLLADGRAGGPDQELHPIR